MSPDEAVWLALATATALVLLVGKRKRSQLFGAVLTRGKKGRLGLSLTPVTKSRKPRRKRGRKS